MKLVVGAAAALALLLPASACEQNTSYADPEEFIRAFVQALVEGDEGRFGGFYLRPEDFDPQTEVAEFSLARFTGKVRDKYLRACRRAAQILSGKAVRITGIDLGNSPAPTAKLLRGVKRHLANVLVRLDAGGKKVSLLIREMIQVGEEWRMTTFATIVDEGTERLPERKEIYPGRDSESGESDPSSSR